MGDAPKRIRQIEEGDVDCSLVHSGIFDYLVKDNVVFYTTVDSWKKSLLDLWINKAIRKEIFCDPIGKNEVVCFCLLYTSDAADE